MSLSNGRRRAGLLIPLFSCTSTSSWGIGDIGDIDPVTAWLAAAGQRVLQLLPMNEMATGQQSPYSAISAMAIDPIFISVAAMPDFTRAGGDALFTRADLAERERVRSAAAVDHAAVRRLKMKAGAAAFEAFHDDEWRRDTARAAAFRAFLRDQAWWIDDYALFRALHAREQNRAWT